ncbi:MAG: hypothetical protein QN716_02565 [Nitrososphaeraceae archaeon]|nr:hypothetical protein [Nitrososphaeraceae archaeon]
MCSVPQVINSSSAATVDQYQTLKMRENQTDLNPPAPSDLFIILLVLSHNVIMKRPSTDRKS